MPERVPADGHPALRAWRRLRPDAADGGAIETLKHDGTSVYRWRPDGSSRALVAKRCGRETARIERAVYEDILPHVPVSHARFHGAVEEDASGHTWLFFDDVGDHRYRSHDPEHRRLAATWLGTMHTGASRIDAARALPRRDPAHYRELLRASRATLARADAGTAARDREVVARLGEAAARVESRWETIANACALLPETLVHGDFIDNNVHVSRDGGVPVLHVIDWEKAGWGHPAEDVSGVDLEAYRAAVRDRWPEVGPDELLRAARAGRLLRCVVYLDWIASRVAAGRIGEVRDDARKCRVWMCRRIRREGPSR